MINEIVQDRIASVHLKDRQTPAHGDGNLRGARATRR
jgi:hypothetical protein